MDKIKVKREKNYTEISYLDGRSLKIWDDGTKVWLKNGKRHQDNGPAVIFPNGSKEWRKNGLLHREDGPAIIYSSYGTKYYYLNGKELQKEEWEKITKSTYCSQ